jgi:hypothetical protein
MSSGERFISTVIATGAFGLACYYAARASFAVDTWAVGDWLINYHGGFVRRGLIGEVVVEASTLTGIGGQWIVLMLKVGCYAAIYGSAIAILLRGKHVTIASALLLLSPAVLLFDAQNNLLAGRKELFFLAWVGLLAASRAINPSKRDQPYVYIALGWILLTAIHEGLFAFWAFFIVFLYLVQPDNSYSPGRLAATALPAGIVFLAGMPLVSPPDLPAICAALGTFAPEGCSLQGAIGNLDASTESAIARVVSEFRLRSLLTVAVALWLSVGFAGWTGRRYKLCRGMTRQKRREAAAFLVLGVPAVAILALVSVDWGRWIHVGATLSAFGVASRIASGQEVVPLGETDYLSNERLRFGRRLVLGGTCAVAVAYLLSWTLPYCCVQGASMSWVRPAIAFVARSWTSGQLTPF